MINNGFNFSCVCSRSNCDPRVGEELRRHYQRPPFLPEQADTSATDWIFMGGPGPGASMHVSIIKNSRLSIIQITLANYSHWRNGATSIFGL
jgi:hypothetical protein